MRETLKILLSEAASKSLLEAGSFFAVIQRGQHPEHEGTRLVIHCLPCDYVTACDAIAVAKGEKRAVKKPATTPAES